MGDETVGSGWASPQTFLMLGGLALLLATVALVSALTGTQTTADGRVHFGWLSLLPALVTVILAFSTRQVLLALVLGVLTGSIVYSFGTSPAGLDPITAFLSFEWLRLNAIRSFFVPEMGTDSFAQIIVVYLWCLGGLIGLWSRTGGAVRFAVSIGRVMVRGPRTAKLFTWILGLLFHQGGNISTVLAGTTARPVLDQHAVAKEESSYIVDSTATSAATLIGLNAWPIFIATVAAGTVPLFTNADGLPDEGAVINFYFGPGIMWNIYAWIAILFTLLLSLNLLPPIFGMRRARKRVEETGETVRPGSMPLVSKELTELHIPPGYKTGLADFAVPMMFLVGITVLPLLFKLALGSPPNVYIVEAFFASVVVAIMVAVIKGMPLRTALDGVLDGSKGVTIAIIILGIAVSLKGVANALGTGIFVSDFLGDMPAMWVAPLLMFCAMLIAFSTGTSFGTFAVLFPVALPLAEAVAPGNVTLLGMAFGAVISGSIFGDQSSPISDTTILSSLSVGCDVIDHVTTQIPYALIAALIAATTFAVSGAILL